MLGDIETIVACEYRSCEQKNEAGSGRGNPPSNRFHYYLLPDESFTQSPGRLSPTESFFWWQLKKVLWDGLRYDISHIVFTFCRLVERIDFARDRMFLIDCSKLISLSMLSTDLLFVAELGVQMDPGQEDEREINRTILRPFGQGEMAFTSALEGEALYSLLSFKSMYSAAKEDPMSNSALLKPNATRNRMYSYYQERMALAEMTPRDFAASMALKEIDGARIRNWSALYNAVGEILNSIAQPNIAGYLAKGHRLECLRRLALLKILAGHERVKPEEMQRFLDAHRADYGNPYSGGSMKWDAQKKRIYLQQVGEDKEVERYL